MAKCPNFTVTPRGTARGATDGMRCGADNNAPNHGVAAEHLDGTFNALSRSERLNWLGSVESDGDHCHILTNVRCLSEGVDVPSLDAILFMQPRKSRVDVVQAVGRVMRRTKDLIVGLFRLVELHSHEFIDQPTKNRPMQNYTDSFSSETSIAVGMDVHKKTIALCMFNARTGGILDERELLHGSPPSLHSIRNPHHYHEAIRRCGMLWYSRIRGYCFPAKLHLHHPYRLPRSLQKTKSWSGHGCARGQLASKPVPANLAPRFTYDAGFDHHLELFDISSMVYFRLTPQLTSDRFLKLPFTITLTTTHL